MYAIEQTQEFQTDFSTNQLTLTVQVTDPIALMELAARTEGQERDLYATKALSVGILCLREVTSHIDVESLQQAGHALIDEAGDLVAARGNELVQQVSAALKEHFDPQTGLFSARLQTLVEKDGELERILGSYLGSENSTLADSLAAYLSEESPIFKLLSPTEKEGIVSHLKQLIDTALVDQRITILKEFSLDNKESALCRFLNEVSAKHGELHDGLQGKIDGVVKEFSLDQPNSALSRLILRVEQAQKSISDQFSTDNHQSAINKLSSMMRDTSEQLTKQLTLDNEHSSLSLIKRELQKSLDSIAQSNAQFHIDVRATLSAFEARKNEAARSTRHGVAFEEAFGAVLASESQNLGDIYTATGTTPGVIRHCKKGDYVVELGGESAAPGSKIVWEVKADNSWDLKKALLELEEARKNREAQIGVFVFSTKTAPDSLKSFGRYGNNIVVVWDSEDVTTDVLIKLVYTLARALVVRDSRAAGENADAIKEIDSAARSLEKQIRQLEELQKWSETIKSNGEKISLKTESMRKELVATVQKLDSQLESMKQDV